MGDSHDDLMGLPAKLSFPSCIVANWGYPLLSWCIAPFKMGSMGTTLTSEEDWFNLKLTL